jgi:Uma2 family endonuclease
MKESCSQTEHYPMSDESVGNLQEPFLAAALTDALGAANRLHSQMLIASNFGLVGAVNGNIVVKAPDWLYVPQVLPVPEGEIRRRYTPNLEGNPVGVVMEFLSDTEAGEYSIRPSFPYGKLFFYEKILKVPTYVIFESLAVVLEVRQLQDNQYVVQQPTEEGRYWIPELELFLGIWHGTRLGLTIPWLRWWDESGNLLSWSSEQAKQERQRADAMANQLEEERQRNQMLIAKLQELGIDPNTLS